MKKVRKRRKLSHKVIVALDARPVDGEVYMEITPDRRGTPAECDEPIEERQEGQSPLAGFGNVTDSKPLR